MSRVGHEVDEDGRTRYAVVTDDEADVVLGPYQYWIDAAVKRNWLDHGLKKIEAFANAETRT